MLRTTFTTAHGVARVVDSLNTGVAGRLPWVGLARRIDGLEGSVALPDPVDIDAGVDRTVENWTAWSRDHHAVGVRQRTR